MDKEKLVLAKHIARYLQGALSEEEKHLFEQKMQKDPDLRAMVDQYGHSGFIDDDFAILDSLDIEQEWQETIHKFQNRKQHKQSFRQWKGWGIAAAMALLMGFAWWQLQTTMEVGVVPDEKYGHKNDVLPGTNKAILTLSNGKEVILGEQDNMGLSDGVAKLQANREHLGYALSAAGEGGYNTITVPKGGIFQVSLPDGSKVWINAESKLSFPIGFTSYDRKVLLEGEAYFDVSEDPNRPFIVQAGDVKVQALGTEFNVNAYKEYDVKTILTQGKVRVSNGLGQKTIEAGRMVRSDEGQKLTVAEADMEEAIAWKEGFFYFSKTDITAILENVGRWYDVQVIYDTKTDNRRFKGGLKRTATLANMCEMLKDLTGYDFEIEKKKLIVKSNHGKERI